MSAEHMTARPELRTLQRATGGCPHFAGYSPVAPDHVADPFPFFERARREAPVFFLPEHDMWCVTRHADILDVLRDPATFSSTAAHTLRVDMPAAIAEEVGDDYVFPLETVLAMSDPPVHTRVRKLIQPAFTPKALRRFEPAVNEIVDGLIDDFIAAGSVELVEAFTRRVPPMVMTTLIGAPIERAYDFQSWVPSLFQLTGDAQMSEEARIKAWSEVIALERFVRAFIVERREHPADDLTSDLIRATTEDGDRLLTDQEILANTIGFIAAGSDTTHVLMAHTLYLLLTHPEQMQQVKDDLDLLPKAIEEALRYRSPAVSVKRTTTRDVELGGVRIPAGSDVWVHVASGNRDESAFERPERFDLNRSDGAKQLGFGLWTHFCIGAPLARMEVEVGLRRLLTRIPEIRLSEAQGPLEYTNNMVIPDLQTLRVEWS